MRPRVLRHGQAPERYLSERCYIRETANDAEDPQVSVARARVLPGVTTAWHRLEGICERYLIIQGRGRVEVEGMDPALVGPGDLVRIPPGAAQRIANVGRDDLVFYCICSPRFDPARYQELE